MTALRIKGVAIGAGAPKTIVPLMSTNPHELVAEARGAIAAGADCLEWRADFLADVHNPDCLTKACVELEKVLADTPLIATLRTTSQGGHLEVGPNEYTLLVQTLATCGTADLVDVEADKDDNLVRDLAQYVREHGVHTIVSFHDFAKTPPTDWMANQICRLHGLGASIPKLAVMARSAADAARLIEATAVAGSRVDAPLITMAMGPHGTITRLAGESFGSAMTFCSLSEASAPGQVGLAHAQAAIDALHVALAKSHTSTDIKTDHGRR